MAFDVSKFLALTVVIAAAGASCTVADEKDNEPTGGTAGTSTSGSAGQGNDAAGADAGGDGNAAGGNGGAGGVDAGGAGAGGVALGGAGGAGGTPEVGECLGSLAEGGAGGEPGVEPSLEDLCGAFFDTCPGAENLPASYSACERVRHVVTPGVAVAFADCVAALSTDDQCDKVKVTECLTGLQGRGCANPDGEAACASITSNCELVDATTCGKVLDLVGVDSTEMVTGCTDPADEGWYNVNFQGSCAERLDYCSGLEF